MATDSITRIGLSDKAVESLEKHFCHLLERSNVRRTEIQARCARIDRGYVREFVLEGAGAEVKEKIQTALDRGDYSVLSTVAVPFILPAVETGVSYQASVFLHDPSLISVIPTPNYIEAGEMMNALIESYQERNRWVTNFMQCLRDGEMYNYFFADVDWTISKSPTLSFSNKNNTTSPTVDPNAIWQGNLLERIDPYNVFWDDTVDISALCELGEFAGYHKLLPRTAVLTKMDSYSNFIKKNKQRAMEEAPDETHALYFSPVINPTVVNSNYNGTTNVNWAQFAGRPYGQSTEKATYVESTVYARIVPKELDITHIPNPSGVHIVKLIYINKVLVSIEFKNNVHGYLPIVGCHPNQSGLGLQNKSTGENAEPFQQISTVLFGSILAARRRAVADRALYDPSKYDPAQINNPNPAAKIPLKPAAYGSNPAEGYYSIPYRDETSPGLISTISQLDVIAQKTLGQNPARQGQFVKGNKTQTEFSDIMAAGAQRDQLKALVIEHDFFSRVKFIIKNNILQYEGTNVLFSRAADKIVNVDPTILRNAILAFKVTDGATPESKIMNDDVWQVAMQTMMSNPAVGMEYRFSDIFAYMMSVKGAKISDFKKAKEQIAYEQASAQWQQSVQQIAELLIKQGKVPAAENYPPQPLPEQFGYNNGPQPPQ